MAKVGDLDELILDADPVRAARRLAVQWVVMAIRRLAGRVGQKLGDRHLLLRRAGHINIPFKRQDALAVLGLDRQVKRPAGIRLGGGRHEFGRDLGGWIRGERPVAGRRHGHLAPGRVFDHRLDHHRLARQQKMIDPRTLEWPPGANQVFVLQRELDRRQLRPGDVLDARRHQLVAALPRPVAHVLRQHTGDIDGVAGKRLADDRLDP